MRYLQGAIKFNRRFRKDYIDIVEKRMNNTRSGCKYSAAY